MRQAFGREAWKVLPVEAPCHDLEVMAFRELFQGSDLGHQLGPMQGVQQLKLSRQSFLLPDVGAENREAAIGDGLQRIQAPEQRPTAQHQNAVRPLPSHPMPQAFP